MVTRARDLIPVLAGEAAESERLRRPTDRAIEALAEAQIFELMVPRVYGGLEFDLDTYVEVGLALGEGDTSLAWIAMFYVEHNWLLCQFPEAFQTELYRDRSFVLAPGSISPVGELTPVEGGYRLSGRWSWATGVSHSDWVMVGGLRPDSGMPPEFLLFALPQEEVKVEDVWHIEGMRATGSNDIVVEDRFVPEERSVSMTAMIEGRSPGAKLHTGPLFRSPMMPILGLAASTGPVGQARACVDGYRERLPERMQYGPLGPQSERAASQMRLGRADLEVRQAALLVHETKRELMARRRNATLLERARWAAQLAKAVHLSLGAVRTIVDGSGATAHFDRDPLQRAARDLSTVSGHVMFDLDQRLETLGRIELGLDPGFSLI
jgi:alkylation response protein AidB-like acyl-CoA dehydrogenase